MVEAETVGDREAKGARRKVKFLMWLINCSQFVDCALIMPAEKGMSMVSAQLTENYFFDDTVGVSSAPMLCLFSITVTV
jgi:hypothetical protein